METQEHGDRGTWDMLPSGLTPSPGLEHSSAGTQGTYLLSPPRHGAELSAPCMATAQVSAW